MESGAARVCPGGGPLQSGALHSGRLRLHTRPVVRCERHRKQVGDALGRSRVAYQSIFADLFLDDGNSNIPILGSTADAPAPFLVSWFTRGRISIQDLSRHRAGCRKSGRPKTSNMRTCRHSSRLRARCMNVAVTCGATASMSFSGSIPCATTYFRPSVDR